MSVGSGQNSVEHRDRRLVLRAGRVPIPLLLERQPDVVVCDGEQQVRLLQVLAQDRERHFALRPRGVEVAKALEHLCVVGARHARTHQRLTV